MMSLQILKKGVCQHRPKLNKLQVSHQQPKLLNTKAFSFHSSHGTKSRSAGTPSCTYQYMLIYRRLQGQSQRIRSSAHSFAARRRKNTSSTGCVRNSTTSSNISGNAIDKTRINHEPPLPIRIALVSTSKNMM